MLAHCSQQTYRLKGFDLFINLAKDLPSHEFVIAGKVSPDIKDYLVLIKPSNLRIEGPLEFMGEDFVDLLNSSKFVMLPSYHESFGCAIVDAAILGCFPLVTSQSALNEVVDKIGRKLPYHDISGFRDAIVELTAMNIDVEEISESYAKRFPINSRKNALVEGIRKVLGHRVE
jgi:glycosyltransferase involved in cell wall biosynthesis